MHTCRWNNIIVASALTVHLPVASAFEVHIQAACSTDINRARRILFQEKMNPLSVSQDYLMVATVEEKNSLKVEQFSRETSARKEKQQEMAGFGQIRPLDEKFAELTSLYVLPTYRHNGVATRLISTLLQRHDDSFHSAMMVTTKSDDARLSRALNPVMVCLLTLRPTIPLYERHGFRIVPPNVLPMAMQIEFVAGTVISSLLGNDLVAMIRRLD